MPLCGIYIGMRTENIRKEIYGVVSRLPNKDSIDQIRLFGSYLHGSQHQESDIDLIVDFNESATVGYFEIVRLQRALEEALGRSVDVVTPRAISKYFRDQVLEEAQLVYEKGSDTN